MSRTQIRQLIETLPKEELVEHMFYYEQQLSIAQEALLWAYEMFVARDKMNVNVHCSPVRLSPITERVQLALQTLKVISKRSEETP